MYKAMKFGQLAIVGFVLAFFNQGLFAQDGTIDWPAIQDEFDAAVAQAEQELKSTDALFLFTRPGGLSLWSLQITGTVAGVVVDYQGVVSTVDNTGLVPVLVMDPPAPVVDASADMLEPMMRAAAVVLLDVDPSVTELYFDVGFPLADTSDPVKFENIDIDALPQFTITQTTSMSPVFQIFSEESGQLLSEQESFSYLVNNLSLSKTAAKGVFSGTMSQDEIDNAFRDAAISLLGEAGVSEQSASDIYDLRIALGNTQEYIEQSLALLLSRGESVVGLFNGDMSAIDPEGPLASMADPDDITITISGETEVSISIPPFVTIKVKAGVSVSGSPSNLAAMRTLLATELAKAAAISKKEAEKQLEDLKELIETLIEDFQEYLDDLQLPGWIDWLF